jgi:hypothetical protein
MRSSSFGFSKVGLARKIFPLFFVLFLVASALFTGCDHNGDDSLTGLPVGTWVSAYGEQYTISKSEFISAYWDDASDSYLDSYKGGIVNIREDGAGAGYITIKYTTAYNPANVNNFYVIHWQNKTETSVDISGAAKAPDYGNGKPTQAEAETEYTVANGYFANYSTCAKQ